MTLNEEQIAERGHPVWVEVDLAAIRHNIRTLAAQASGAEVMGVVKGYAYGHGNPQCAQAIVEAGATRLGVARVAEGVHLREAGIRVPIHVLTEPPRSGIPTMLEHDLVPTIYTESFVSALSDEARKREREVAVHLKVDTGMHRVGVPEEDLDDALAFLKDTPILVVEGVWSHLAVADVPTHPFNRNQLDLFISAADRVEAALGPVRYRHLANSAATMSAPETHFDIVRCGIASYGLWPSNDLLNVLDLRPALAMRARINMVKNVKSGEALSYGLRYQLQDDGHVVTVTAGYADGYDRRLSGRADVLIDGRRHLVSGTVCMDSIMVDVGPDTPEAGNIVTLLGADGDDRISAEELAIHVGTINYEVTTRIPSRVPRVFLDEEAHA